MHININELNEMYIPQTYVSSTREKPSGHVASWLIKDATVLFTVKRPVSHCKSLPYTKSVSRSTLSWTKLPHAILLYLEMEAFPMMIT